MAESDADESAVILPWSRTGSTGLRVAAGIFAAFLFTLSLRQGQFQPLHRGLIAFGGAVIVYHLVAAWLNATRLSLRDQRLVVEHGPLPLRRRLSLPLDQLDRVVCDRFSRRLELHTVLGEQLVVLEALQPSLLEEAERAIADRLPIAPRVPVE